MVYIYILHRSQTNYKEFGEYLKAFTFPRRAPGVAHLFDDDANRNNYRKGNFTCTGSEFLTLVPVLHRYFSCVVSLREECMEHVNSMLAVLMVVMLLQSVRSGQVSAGALAAAIFHHMTCFLACYGEDFIRPKHHYCLHLPQMLRHFGFLLATFTHERKHRLVTKYTRDRKAGKSWDTGAIEDITVHQNWELKQSFFLTSTTTAPARGLKMALQECFPDVAPADIFVVNGFPGNGGQISNGDVVSFMSEGEFHLGELLVTVGLRSTSQTFAFVCEWTSKDVSTDKCWVTYTVSDTNVKKVDAALIDTCFTYSMGAGRRTASVYLPPELRPES